MPTREDRFIPFQLGQAQRRHNIGHVALKIWRDNIVLPGPQFGFRQSVFILPMQREQHKLLIDISVIHARDIPPGNRAAFSGGQVFNRMEREGGEIRNFTSDFSLPGSA